MRDQKLKIYGTTVACDAVLLLLPCGLPNDAEDRASSAERLLLVAFLTVQFCTQPSDSSRFS
jgi:hypothetical protein